MGIMVRDTVLCVLTLLQLLSPALGVRIPGGRKLELPTQAPLNAADKTKVLRSYLVHRDSLRTGSSNASTKTSTEKFLDAVKRSRIRVQQLQKSLRGLRSVDRETKAESHLQSPVSLGGGDYVMQISVGTPPQTLSAIVDTGSDLSWVQCLPCTSCFQQPDSIFDPTASSTYTPANCTDPLCMGLPEPICDSRNVCTYGYSYGDGSFTEGDLAYDAVTLDSVVVGIGFGCGHDQEGSFAGSDGLVGLGQGPLSLPSQLSPTIANIFSYCLVSGTPLGTASSPITFGNASENSHVAYTPLLANPQLPTYYYVGVTGISVGSRRVSIRASEFEIQADGGGGTILDSGTTLTYWMPTILNPILAAFRRQIGYPEVDGFAYGLRLCYDISSALASGDLSLPSMTVHMTNVDWKIPVSNLFVIVDTMGQTACLAMGSSHGFSIIGNIQQKNNLIVYDVVNQRIGFRKVNDCATLT